MPTSGQRKEGNGQIAPGKIPFPGHLSQQKNGVPQLNSLPFEARKDIVTPGKRTPQPTTNPILIAPTTVNSMTIPFASKIQTVSELTRSIKVLLENGFAFVAICGEISNLKRPYSGHLYFTLQDANAQIKAVLFKTQRRYLARDLADGHQVVCRGRISVYEPRGDYQLIVDSVEFAGSGDRQAAYEQLKERLYQEGLFAESYKKKFPLLPKGIALITSPRGAAIHDFLTVAARRSPSIPIEILPVAVQGESAAAEVRRAITTAIARNRCEVIVICRGGGSTEDLWPFNDEALARTVFQSPLPIVSAIGHEIDFTILDFVADHRAPTPTAAAEFVFPDQGQLAYQVRQHRLRQRAIVQDTLTNYQNRLALQNRLLGDPTRAINNLTMRIDFATNRLHQALSRRQAHRQQQLANQQTILTRHHPQAILTRHHNNITTLRGKLLELSQRHLERKIAAVRHFSSLIRSLSPLAILERGYAIVQRLPDKNIIRSGQETKTGDQLEIRLHEGRIGCEVKRIVP